MSIWLTNPRFMNNRKNEFVQLVNRAVSDSKFSHMRNAIEKELLIYNILFCLEQHDLLDKIVFQGGTLLRLGHSGERLIEELELVAGEEFSPSDFSPIKLVIEEFFFDRFGLNAEVIEPIIASGDLESRGITVIRWRVDVTINPERRELPKQRIKIEVANVPAHTKEIISVRTHYEFLPDGYDDALIASETLKEVMADKLISLPATTREIQYRDHIEMQKLLPSDVFDRTLRKEKFCNHLLSSVQELFEQIRNSMN